MYTATLKYIGECNKKKSFFWFVFSLRRSWENCVWRKKNASSFFFERESRKVRIEELLISLRRESVRKNTREFDEETFFFFSMKEPLFLSGVKSRGIYLKGRSARLQMMTTPANVTRRRRWWPGTESRCNVSTCHLMGIAELRVNCLGNRRNIGINERTVWWLNRCNRKMGRNWCLAGFLGCKNPSWNLSWEIKEKVDIWLNGICFMVI